MTLAVESAALGLADSKIYGWTGSSYDTTGIDIPKVVQLEFGPVIESKELEGDDLVSIFSFVKNYEGKLAFNKIPLSVLETMFGGTLESSGETPNQKQTYTFPAVSTALNKFKLAGQATKVDSGLGDVLVTLTGCKIKAGSYPIALKYNEYANITVDVFIEDQPTIELNETATTIATSEDTTAPTITATVPADAEEAAVVSANLTCTFSEAIQAGSVTAKNFVLLKASDGTIVAGSLSLGTNDTVVTFNPTSDLSAATDYIWIITGVRDVAGNILAAPTVVNFKTAS
jgi:hypothetical protein